MIIKNAGYNTITETNPLKKIERIARICYKSEDKICDGSDERMIASLISRPRQHIAMLEHAAIAVIVTKDLYEQVFTQVRRKMETNISATQNIAFAPSLPRHRYLRFTETPLCNANGDDSKNAEYFVADGETSFTRYIISGNIRAWLEYFIDAGIVPTELYSVVDDMAHNIFSKYAISAYKTPVMTDKKHVVPVQSMSQLSPNERMVHELFTVLFTTDRGITHELVRMREASFAQESTRYCNYSNDKFGSEITVIKPCFEAWANNESKLYAIWEKACLAAEKAYFELLEAGATPQEARDVLPTSVKSDIAVTANLTEWRHIFELRVCDTTGAAHPQMHEIMCPLFIEARSKYDFAFGDLVMPNEFHK